MARQTNPGTLLLVFNFYAKLFAPHQQMTKKVPTYSEIMFANNTLSQGEVMCFCVDFRIVPHLLTRNDVRNIWPFIGEEHGGDSSDVKRVGKELSLGGFQEFLVRVALLNGLTPEGRPNKLCEDRMPHSAINALVRWLHLDDRMAIKHKLATVGKKTQQRLASTSHESSLGNPYTKFDANRFTMLESLNPKRQSIGDMIAEANRSTRATKKRGRRNATVSVTQGSAVVQKAMKSYHHSLKHSFAKFDSELITTSWKKFQRDRATGQISRAYIDAGDVREGLEYHFIVKIKNQTKRGMYVTGVGLRGDGGEGDVPGMDGEERDDPSLTLTTKDATAANSDAASEEGGEKQDPDRYNISVRLDVETEDHESGRDTPKALVLHPGATRKLAVAVKALRSCEVFRMLQFRAVTVSNKEARRGTTFFDKSASDSMRKALLTSSEHSVTDKNKNMTAELALKAKGAIDTTEALLHQQREDAGAAPIAADAAEALAAAEKVDRSRPNSRNRNRSRPGTGKSRGAAAEVAAAAAVANTPAGTQIVVNCPLYLRCPCARDFYAQPKRLQQTLHQRMSLPPSAFDDDGNLAATYDGFDLDKGTFTASTMHPFGGAPDEEDELFVTSRSRRSSRRRGLLAAPSADEDDDSEEAMMRRTGFLGDNPAAKAARDRAREMREKLSKTEYMLELEQKTKDCWDGNYQFQRDRSATYRAAPARAAQKAKQILLAATRGGKDVAWQIPMLDVRLRMLAPTPKMEWKAREPEMAGVVQTEGAVRDAADRFKDGVDRQHASSSRIEHYAPMPVFHMKPVTKFSGLDMRNGKHLYAMLHGSTDSLAGKNASRTGPWKRDDGKMTRRSSKMSSRSRSTVFSREGRLTRPGTGLSQSSSLPLLATGRPM